MPGGVAGDFDHVEAQSQRLQAVAANELGQGLGHGFARRAKHLGACGLAQCVHSASMVEVMVRD